MPAQNDVEMGYKPAEQMSQAQQPSTADACAAEQSCSHNATETKPKRTFLGMRGGGLILDLCACFICCECVEGCCNALDDCCCC